jgi:hypothetical protein
MGMALLDDLLNGPLLKKRSPCKITQITKPLSEEEQAAFRAAVDLARTEPQIYTIQWLVDTLTDNGIMVTRSTMTRHIHKDCGCE